MADTLNPSEAVYGFAAWLTSRKEQTVMSASDDAAPIVELIKQFCEINNLPEISEQWPQHLVHPKGEVAVPGSGHNQENTTGALQCTECQQRYEPGSNFCSLCGSPI